MLSKHWSAEAESLGCAKVRAKNVPGDGRQEGGRGERLRGTSGYRAITVFAKSAGQVNSLFAPQAAKVRGHGLADRTALYGEGQR